LQEVIEPESPLECADIDSTSLKVASGVVVVNRNDRGGENCPSYTANGIREPRVEH
jgi:hypothetical protein